MLPTTRFFFIFLLFFAFAPLFGQQSLTGQLLDEEGAALGFANVMLLHPEDSSLVKGTVSEADGSFAFEVEEPGAYLLEVAMIGFRDYHQRINLAQSRELPPITLETEITQLSTVEVRARQPLLEQRGNKMIVNVGNSITGTAGSAMDLLRKVPGLLVINNQISMAGQSNISVLINGKPTQYLDVQSLLRDYPADNIERIEVINQPGARFDAEGNGGILNIVLKKNVKLGTNGGIRLRTGRGQYWKYGAATALHYRDERVNWSNRLSYNQNSHYEEMVLDRKVGDLILSDIELLDGNAFQVLENRPLQCPIIFATAYDQYLLQAFQANGIAYLLKLYNFEQFQEAMHKYKRLIAQSAPPISTKVVEELKQALQPVFRQYRQRFTVKKPKGIVLLQTVDISYFTAEDKGSRNNNLPKRGNATPFPKPCLNWKSPSTPLLFSGLTGAKLYSLTTHCAWSLLVKTAWRCTCGAVKKHWPPAPAGRPSCGGGWRGDKTHSFWLSIFFTLSY